MRDADDMDLESTPKRSCSSWRRAGTSPSRYRWLVKRSDSAGILRASDKTRIRCFLDQGWWAIDDAPRRRSISAPTEIMTWDKRRRRCTGGTCGAATEECGTIRIYFRDRKPVEVKVGVRRIRALESNRLCRREGKRDW